MPNLGRWLPGLLVGSDGPAAEFGRPAQSADRCNGMCGRRERAARLCVLPCLAHRFVESSDGPPVVSAHISGHELADTTQAHAPAPAPGLGAPRRLRAAPGRPRALDPVDRGVRRRGRSRLGLRRSPRRRCHRRRALRRRHALNPRLLDGAPRRQPVPAEAAIRGLPVRQLRGPAALTRMRTAGSSR
jgi:hypothetical protein